MELVISFTKNNLPYGWMGNMSAYPIIYKDKKWLTSEALFQAMRFKDEKIIEEIRLQKSPMGAKMVAKKYKNIMIIEPMSKIDVENMEICLRLKFEQHPTLAKKLLITGNHLIVEDIGKRNGERHLFWGMKCVNGEWLGSNTMGVLLMKLRDEFKMKS